MIRILLIFCVSIGAWLFFMVLAQAQNLEVIPEKKDPQAYCLAQNIYFEASTEPMVGKIAVGMVVINRVKDARTLQEYIDVARKFLAYLHSEAQCMNL